MTCPSCDHVSTEATAHCVRCGFSLKHFGRPLLVARGAYLWVLRRSLAGAATGLVGWCIIPAVSRAAGAELSQAGHLMLTGLIGGVFLGTVEGMMEESTLKTLKGGAAGAFGGMIGGGIASLIVARSQSGPAGMAAVIVTWALAGLAVGLLSAWMEVRLSRRLAGALAGALGGAIGGWLGYQVYASLMDVAKIDLWSLKRLVEGMTGGILGAVLWFSIGVAEKSLIFVRRPARAKDHKTCDSCHHASPLNAWYCGSCGAILQEAAAPDRLSLPRHAGLERLVSGLQFLSRLSGTASAVAAVAASWLLGGVNVFLGLFALLATALLGYLVSILFSAAADWLEATAE
jgi:hypothetical protein